MNLYLIEDVSHVSDSYHNSGSILVAAESKNAALALAPVSGEYEPDLDKIREARAEAIRIIGTTDLPAQVWVFPDAGCC